MAVARSSRLTSFCSESRRANQSVNQARASARERVAIAPLVVLILVLGLYPKPVLSMIEESTTLLQTTVGGR